MRLQLTALFLASSVAFAGGEASTRIEVYSDGLIQVVVPAVQVGWEGKKVAVEGTMVADVLSGATQVLVADVVSSATTFSEVRKAGGISVTYAAKPTRTYSVSHQLSHEPDYLTNATSIGFSEELFKRMSKLSLSYGLSLEKQGRADDDAFSAFAHGHRLDVGWDQILNKRTKATLLVTANALYCEEKPGCLANPYRYVAVSTPDGTMLALPEKNPAQLFRFAVGTRVARALGPTTAIHGSYRYYADTWKVSGHTAELSAKQSLGRDHVLLGLRVRGVVQSGASFYRDSYLTAEDVFALPGFRTGDRELAGLVSLQLGGGLAYTWFGVGPLEDLTVSARLSHTGYRYRDFSELPSRSAWVGGGGLHGSL